MEKLNIFFDILSERVNNENNLSDISWAMMETIGNKFKKDFLEFIFNEKINKDKPIEVVREYTEHTSSVRPDFYFNVDNKKFIVEIKKYDKEKHEDYLKLFPDCNFGFLSIYTYSHSKIKTKTWSDFYWYINNNLDNYSDTDKKLLSAYLKYIKNTCNITKFKKMDLSKLQSLYYFDTLIEKIINNLNSEKYEAKVYRKTIKKDRTGKYIELYHKNYKKTIYPWFGIFYNETDLNIYINYRIEESWCDNITKEMHHGEKLTKKFMTYFSDYDYEFWEDAVWIGMNEKEFEDFNNAKIKEQEEKLENFVSKILNITDAFFE